MPRARWPRCALILALVTAGACTHARPEARADASADAIANPVAEATAGDVPPVVDDYYPPDQEPGPPRWRVSEVDPRLVVREGSDELGFLEQQCAYDEPCGCLVAAEHRYRRRGDGWSITVVLPEVEIRRIVKRGTCIESCGHPMPPEPPSIRSLGAIAPTAVEIDVQRPRKVVKKRTCTDPLAPP
ncbi:hypothetical protein SAMN02745121_07607 [Nannocystis exedens]|uniref:Uncharacterized protein n=1 Tax=Nannocystis exedens TaxID=54 RepID=A0A1I2GXU4_9BACT|nr:hypothetical protein [Nannocystis exedens]PCC68864.1 hypothetical protein NAEX_01884 [Nannocystis exedens]SFF22565.1 hypothetical protein SAMN02745121_07607 [Nannocystis exedens]